MIGALSKRGQEETNWPGARKLGVMQFEIGSRNFSSESTREDSPSHQETGAKGTIQKHGIHKPSIHGEDLPTFGK